MRQGKRDTNSSVSSLKQSNVHLRLSLTDGTHTMLATSHDLPTGMARPLWSLDDYKLLERVYLGSASSVYRALCLNSREIVCLKVYELSKVGDLNQFQIFREVKLHASLNHTSVVTLYGAFQQGDRVVLVQEFAEGGDLFSMLHKIGGKMAENSVVELVLIPLMHILHHLHTQHNIVHRDIKPENILFTKQMEFKLCDFGLAINEQRERPVTRAGTLDYMAPEVLQCPFKNKPEENKEKYNLYYDKGVDSWALGVLAYELLVGLTPFADRNGSEVEHKIRSSALVFPASMSDLARSFITDALQRDRSLRPNIASLIVHPWIVTYSKRNVAPAVLHPMRDSVRARSEPGLLPSNLEFLRNGKLSPVPMDGSVSQSHCGSLSEPSSPTVAAHTSKKSMVAAHSSLRMSQQAILHMSRSMTNLLPPLRNDVPQVQSPSRMRPAVLSTLSVIPTEPQHGAAHCTFTPSTLSRQS